MGVGALTALTFVLTLEDPRRFAKSRVVGAYLGLVPGKDQSGERDPQERISKEGDEMLRRLLVGSAHYILGPFGRDSDLRRHGLEVASRGGKRTPRNARRWPWPANSRCSYVGCGSRESSTSRCTISSDPQAGRLRIGGNDLSSGDQREEEVMILAATRSGLTRVRGWKHDTGS